MPHGQRFPMKTRLILNLIFAMACVFTSMSVPASVARAQQKTCGDSDLPAPIQELIKTKFPLLRPKQFSDIGTDDQKLVSKAHKNDCPGIMAGHFESKDQLAYAVLLVARSEPTGGYLLVVFSKDAKGDSYSWKLVNQVEGHKDQIDSSALVISRVPPGKYSDFQNTRSIRMSLDGILLGWIESGADLFYWSGGRYQKLNVTEMDVTP